MLNLLQLLSSLAHCWIQVLGSLLFKEKNHALPYMRRDLGNGGSTYL